VRDRVQSCLRRLRPLEPGNLQRFRFGQSPPSCSPTATCDFFPLFVFTCFKPKAMDKNRPPFHFVTARYVSGFLPLSFDNSRSYWESSSSKGILLIVASLYSLSSVTFTSH
jgi:hypothetical protein